MQPERSPSTGWFAVQVKPKHEKNVSVALEYKGLEAFLPLYRARRKWSDRVRESQLPLFPGYVFCKFNPLRLTPILSTPGVYDVVRFGRTLATLDSDEIVALQNLMRSGLPSEPWPRLEIGQLVEIEDGPLIGCKGVIVEFKKLPRLVLSVTLLRRSVLVELDRSWVKGVSNSATFRSVSYSA
jgi:transcription antitermination factor NusG